LQAYNSAHEKPPSRAALGTRAFSISKRQQNGPPGFKALEEAVAKIHVFCPQAAAIRLRKSVEVVASPTSGCSEIEMRGIKHGDKPGPGTPIATDRDPTPHD